VLLVLLAQLRVMVATVVLLPSLSEQQPILLAVVLVVRLLPMAIKAVLAGLLLRAIRTIQAGQVVTGLTVVVQVVEAVEQVRKGMGTTEQHPLVVVRRPIMVV